MVGPDPNTQIYFTLKRLALRIKVSLMRTCHPGPVALNAASACLSSRNETSSLVPLPKGRPRLTSLPPLYKSPLANHSSVSSGASSSGSNPDFIVLLFTVICFPHRNNVSSITAWRPDHNTQPPIYKPKRNKSLLAIVIAQILNDIFINAKHFSGRSKIEPALCQSHLPLRLVPREPHLTFIQRYM